MSDRLWGVVLAGGEGMRLKALAQRICGDSRPKQYVPVLGDRTLLRQTLERVALGIPTTRTVVVTVRRHAPELSEEWTEREAPRVLVQPADRGTAAGILFPAHWVARQDAGATLAVFPSDHFVSEPAIFMEHIVRVAAWLNEHAGWLVLLGAPAAHPEVEYGWIEAGRSLDSTDDCRIWQVHRFWEKPSEEQAHACLQAGCLWNTFILVGKVSAFLRAGREAMPRVDERLALLERFLGTDEEAWALDQAYTLMPSANFSRATLESCPPFLAVARMPRVGWSDLGTPRRVFEVLGRAQDRPAWVRAEELTVS